MDAIKKHLEDMQTLVDEIESELDVAEEKGKFVYARSRNIRKAASEIAKLAKEIRISSQAVLAEATNNK